MTVADEPVVAAETPERPAWLPEKFESPEALAQSYAEAEREMGRLRAQSEQERAQFQATLEAVQTQPTQQFQQSNGNDPKVAAYEQAWQNGDTAAMLRIQAEMAGEAIVPVVANLLDEKIGRFEPAIEAQQAHVRESSIRMAEDVVARTIGPENYEALMPSIRTLVADHPHYLPTSANVEGYAAAILDVVKLAQHETLVKQVADLKAERSEKLAAQQLTGGGNRSVYTTDQQKAEFERIKATPGGTFSEVLARSS